MITRQLYIDRIRPFYRSNFIKVITGVRRCGKTVLLRQLADDIASDPALAARTELISFEDFDNRGLRDPELLHAHLQEIIRSSENVYLFLDEVQLVPHFESVVNSLHAKGEANIFMTGSNSSILSGELATLLGGRTLSFRVMPFNFREFCAFKRERAQKAQPDEPAGAKQPALDKNALLQEFLTWGAMPLVCAESSDEAKMVVLDNLYNSIVLRDIVNRTNVKSPTALQDVLDYIIANTSTAVSGNNIAAALSKKSTISAPTVYSYIEAIQDAFIVDLVAQFDIRGKRALASRKKAYVCDLGFFRMRKNRVKDEMSYIVETAVYNELVSRGFSVHVGKLANAEIDFVAEREGKRHYIQAAYLLSDESVVEREFGAFEHVRDAASRYVISCDPVTVADERARHISLLDFLDGETLV